MTIKDIPEFKYLENIIYSEGTNMKDLQGKYNIWIEIINKITTIIETIDFDDLNFKCWKNLIESMLLVSILNNIKVEVEIKKLERCHEFLILPKLSIPSKRQMLYFITGWKPKRILIHIIWLVICTM